MTITRVNDSATRLSNAQHTRAIRHGRRRILAAVGKSIESKAEPTERTWKRKGVTLSRWDTWNAVPWRRVCSCGNANMEHVTQAWATNESGDGFAYFSEGVNRCASVWLCALCTAKIRRQYTADVQALALWNAARGGELGMLTLTLAHTRGDKLKKLVNGLCEALRRVQRSVLWESIKDLIDGFVRALELTHGFGSVDNKNGWHPHFHLLFVIPPGCNSSGDSFADTLEAIMNTWLYDEWADAVEIELGRVHRPSIGRGFDYKRIPPDAAAYVAKISQEVTRGDLKSAARQPWDIIDRMGLVGRQWRHERKKATAQWCEYVDGMKGKNSVRWSPGLRDMAGLTAELTPDEICAQLVDGGEDEMQYPKGVYMAAKNAGVEHRLLEVSERDHLFLAESGIAWTGGLTHDERDGWWPTDDG